MQIFGSGGSLHLEWNDLARLSRPRSHQTETVWKIVMRYASLICVMSLLFIGSSFAQTPCDSFFAIGKCAQQAAAVADRAEKAVKALTERIDELSKVVEASRRARLECRQVNRLGRRATCPADFTAVSCHAGMNRGTHSIANNECDTGQPDTDWTEATCCRIVQ